MITNHHLNNSRSHRILWLLEELQVPYNLVMHARDGMRAPESLKQIHPIGKAPIITDGDLVLAESGAIVAYLIGNYGAGKLAPKRGTNEYARYLFWLHFAEGSMMQPGMTSFYASMIGEAGAPIREMGERQSAVHLDFMEKDLGENPFVLGQQFTGADIMVSYGLEVSDRLGRLGAYPRLAAYLHRLHDRPAYKVAVAKGGEPSMARRTPATAKAG
jgi:glutathione S-transferase